MCQNRCAHTLKRHTCTLRHFRLTPGFRKEGAPAQEGERGSYINCPCSHSRYFIALQNYTKRSNIVGGKIKALVDLLFCKLRPAYFNREKPSSVFFFCFYMSKNDGPLQGIYKLLQPPFLSLRNSCCFKNLKGD